MVVTQADDLFSLIEREKLTVVLFITPQLVSHKYLCSISENKNVIKYIVTEDNTKDLQIVKIPQIRIYKSGNEKINLFGNQILNWEKHL